MTDLPELPECIRGINHRCWPAAVRPPELATDLNVPPDGRRLVTWSTTVNSDSARESVTAAAGARCACGINDGCGAMPQRARAATNAILKFVDGCGPPQSGMTVRLWCAGPSDSWVFVVVGCLANSGAPA